MYGCSTASWAASPIAPQDGQRSARRPIPIRSCGRSGRGCRLRRRKAVQTARQEKVRSDRVEEAPATGMGTSQLRRGKGGYGEERANLGDHASCTHRHAPSDRDVRQDSHVPTEPTVVPDRDRSAALGASSAVPDCRVEWMRSRKAVSVQKQSRPD